MVENPGKAASAGTYQPVNAPAPVAVDEDASGLPRAVIMRRRQTVTAIEDRWRIDDEWWRSDPISRLYYSVRLTSGQRLVVYKDVIDCAWYRQAY
jgi:hypothetical protein